MPNDSFVCPECGYNKGGMAMQGNGLLRCPGCNSLLMVTGWGFIKVIRKGVRIGHTDSQDTDGTQ